MPQDDFEKNLKSSVFLMKRTQGDELLFHARNSSKKWDVVSAMTWLLIWGCPTPPAWIISCVVSWAKKLLKGYDFKNIISAVRMSTIDNIFSLLLYWFEFHPGSYAEISIFLIVFKMSLVPNLWFLVDYIDKHTCIRLSHMISWVVKLGRSFI